MSAVRSVHRIPLPRRAISPISPSCIRHTPPICLRRIHSSRSAPPPSSRGSFGDFLPQSRQPRQRRLYATIIHNQKYNDDKVPLTLEITPSCAQVRLFFFLPADNQQLSKVQARENNPNLMLR